MEYFDFYELPVSFKIDEKQLKKQFLKKSRDYHPDFFTLESQDKQEEILKLSTLNNNAYKVLKDFDLRMKYILDQSGTLKGEGQDKMDQSFLMEMMEINEVIMELQFEPDESEKQKVLEKVSAFEQDLKKDLAPFLEKEFNLLTVDEKESIKQYYLKNKYLKRIKQNLANQEPDI